MNKNENHCSVDFELKTEYARRKYGDILRRMKTLTAGGWVEKETEAAISVTPEVHREIAASPGESTGETTGGTTRQPARTEDSSDKDSERPARPANARRQSTYEKPEKPVKKKRGRPKGSKVVDGKVVVSPVQEEAKGPEQEPEEAEIETVNGIAAEDCTEEAVTSPAIALSAISGPLGDEDRGHSLLPVAVNLPGASLAVVEVIEGEFADKECFSYRAPRKERFCAVVSRFRARAAVVCSAMFKKPVVRSAVMACSIGLLFVSSYCMFSSINLDKAQSAEKAPVVSVAPIRIQKEETDGITLEPVSSIETFDFEMVGSELIGVTGKTTPDKPSVVAEEDKPSVVAEEEVIPDIRSSLDGDLMMNSVLDDDRETELQLLELEIKEMKLNLLRKQLESKSSKITVQEEKKEKRTTDSRQEDIDKLASYIEKVRTGNSSVSREEMQKIAVNVYKYSDKYNLPVGLVVGVMQTESNFRPSAVSSADARGLMQVMWKYHSARLQKAGIKAKEELHDVEKGIQAGCIILAGYIEAEKSITKALGRYYGVLHQQYVSTVKSYWETFELVNAGMLDEAEWKVAVEKTRSAWSNLFARVSTSKKSSSSSSSAAKKQAAPASAPKASVSVSVSDERPADKSSSTMIYNNRITIKKADGTTTTWTDSK